MMFVTVPQCPTHTSGGTAGCSTGCPHCGCCNPNCSRRDMIITYEREPMFDLGAFKRIEPRPWVQMKQHPRTYRGA